MSKFFEKNLNVGAGLSARPIIKKIKEFIRCGIAPIVNNVDGSPLEFTPHLMRGGNDYLRGYFIEHGSCSPSPRWTTTR